MDSKSTKGHPETRGDRNPLRSRRLRRELHKNRFVPHKKNEGETQEESQAQGEATGAAGNS